MAEYIDDIDYWKSVALTQKLARIQAEGNAAADALQRFTDEVYVKYGLTKGVDSLVEDGEKIAIKRAAKIEAVK